MTAASTAATPTSAAPTWPTPRILRSYQLMIWVLAGFLFLAGETTLDRARGAVKTIGKDAAPSILAAQEIGSAFADLDANAANYLVGTSQHRADAMRVLEERRVQLTRRLVDAAQNITYGEAEKQPIQTMIGELGRYLEAFAVASYRHDAGDGVGAVESYRAATAILHEKLIPAANALDGANRRYLDEAYSDQARASSGAEWTALLFGGALVAALFFLQLFLVRRTRRIFNPALLAATILAVTFTAYLVRDFGDARADLKLAKEDAFDSIHTMWKARAIAYDANGEESRWLLDPANTRASQSAFDALVAQLTDDPTGAWIRGFVTDRNGGLFAREMRNVTFAGESDAMHDVVAAFARYYAIDAQIRALENAGKHAQAVELCIGSGADESNAAFAAFDRALVRVVDINTKELSGAMAHADDALGRAEKLDPAIALGIALLAWLGLRARLKEYQ